MTPILALAELKTSLNKHGLDDWSAGLDNAVKRFGVCDLGKKHISLSRALCELNSDAEVTDTILHEIAHALAFERHGKNCGHDKRWKKICVEIGAKPEACCDDSVIQPDAPWLLVHKTTNEVFHSYYKRPKRNWSQVWIRGRKEETLGQLTIKSRNWVNNKNRDTGNPGNGQTDKEKDTTHSSQEDSSPEPILSFTPKTVLQVHEDLSAMIQAYAEQHGLEAGNSKCKYSAVNCDISLSLNVPSSVDAEEMARIDFNALAPIFDLTAEDYQRPFKVNGRTFKLVAFKPNNRKYPIIGEDETGRQYKFEMNVIDQLMQA